MTLPLVDTFITTKTLIALTHVSKLLGELKGVVLSHPNPERFTRMCRMKLIHDAMLYQEIPIAPEDLGLDLIVIKRRHFDVHPAVMDDRGLTFAEEEMKHLKVLGYYFLKSLHFKINPYADKTFLIKPITYPYEEEDMIDALSLIDTWLSTHPDVHPLLLLPWIYAHLHHLQAFTHLNERLIAIYVHAYLIKVTELEKPLLSLHHVFYQKKQAFETLLNAVNGENPPWEELTLFFLDAMKTMIFYSLAAIKTLDQMHTREIAYLQTTYPHKRTKVWVDHFFEYPTTKVMNIIRSLGIGRKAIYNYISMFKESGYITYGKIGSEEVIEHQKLKSWLEKSFYVNQSIHE